MALRFKPNRFGFGSIPGLLFAVGLVVGMSACDACSRSPAQRGHDASYVDTSRSDCGGQECEAGEICYRDRCTPTCYDDSECLEGERCTQDGFCYPAQSSVEGAPCLEDEHCHSMICGDDGHCVPPRSCLTDGECFPEEVCSDEGFCIPECADPANCGGGDDGDADAGYDDADVVERIPECLLNEDCEDETYRCEDGMCVPLEICEDDIDCDEGTYCHRGQCRPWCSDNEDCRGEQLCIDQRCVDVEEDASCMSTDDCEPCESCIYGVCTLSEFFCRVDDDCGYDKVCQLGFCAFECEADEECPRGQVCIDEVCLDDPPETAECVFNEECDEGATCINGRCNIECETHSECGYLEMCDHGVCQPDRRPGAECVFNSHCVDQDARAQCVDGHCALPCFEDADCVTLTCEYGFCTR